MSAVTSEDNKKKNRPLTTKDLRHNHELQNPCLKEHKMSLKCLDDNNYNKYACQAHFMNYKKCKEFWSYVTSQRKSRGIKPYLPVPEDREAVKEEYLKTYIP